MFERLVMKKEDRTLEYPCVTLTHQRRMRPEISSIMNIIYPTLKNSDSVYHRPNIAGLGGKSVFFLNHRYQEEVELRMQSKKNPK